MHLLYNHLFLSYDQAQLSPNVPKIVLEWSCKILSGFRKVLIGNTTALKASIDQIKCTFANSCLFTFFGLLLNLCNVCFLMITCLITDGNWNIHFKSGFWTGFSKLNNWKELFRLKWQKEKPKNVKPISENYMFWQKISVFTSKVWFTGVFLLCLAVMS